MKGEKTVLILGATGAMGVYLIPELLRLGYRVRAVSLDDCVSHDSQLVYTKADAMDLGVLEELLKEGYGCIVDFLIYPTERFRERYKMFLEHTDQYIYLSSYRIYANEEHPITENSPRLLDVSPDAALRASEDYCVYKARGEDMLAQSGCGNWTIIRPAITYSQRKMQLVTLEAPVHVFRASQGKTVVLPEAAMEVEGTMSWGGDVAKMIARLAFNPAALGERFTVSTAEHHPWRTIASYYEEILGMKYVTASTDDYIWIHADSDPVLGARRQLEYDRLFDRIIDNRKILEYTGLKQSDLTPLREGLRRELTALPKNFVWPHTDINDRMDAYLAARR